MLQKSGHSLLLPAGCKASRLVVAQLIVSATEGSCREGRGMHVRAACCILLAVAMAVAELPVWQAHGCDHRGQLLCGAPAVSRHARCARGCTGETARGCCGREAAERESSSMQSSSMHHKVCALTACWFQLAVRP